jgi:hypothetical protein
LCNRPGLLSGRFRFYLVRNFIDQVPENDTRCVYRRSCGKRSTVRLGDTELVALTVLLCPSSRQLLFLVVPTSQSCGMNPVEGSAFAMLPRS